MMSKVNNKNILSSKTINLDVLSGEVRLRSGSGFRNFPAIGNVDSLILQTLFRFDNSNTLISVLNVLRQPQ
jgi:hypothetical protein